MAIGPSTTSERTVFRLKHSDKAVECSATKLLLSPSSNSPNQLWSKFKGVNGQCFINRGTGAYLEVDNGVVQTKIESVYEWNVQEQGEGSVGLETPQRMLLKATQQNIELSLSADANTLFAIDYVPNPTLSVGSEDYIHSSEHTCVTNHIFNAVNALNAIIHILEKPDKEMRPGLDKMVLRYTPEHFAQFKARGSEATQNFDFASATVASWFLGIGAKIEAENKNSGNLSNSNSTEEAKRTAAEKVLVQLTTTHQATLANVQAQQTKYDSANTNYNNAVTNHNTAVSKEKSAKKFYDDTLFMPDPSGSGAAVLTSSFRLSSAQAEAKAAKEKMDSRERERKEANDLLTTLKSGSKKEETDMAARLGEANNAKATESENNAKLAQLKVHHDTLIKLHNSINDCRAHLGNTLQYKVSDGSSLTVVRQSVKGIVEVLRKDDDFKEPLKILDEAALDELMKKIPDISGHVITGT